MNGKDQQFSPQWILDNSAHPIFITTLAGQFLDCNLAAQQLLGYERKALQELTIMDILLPEQRSSLLAVSQNLKFAANGGIQGVVLKSKTKESIKIEFTVSNCTYSNEPAYIISVYDLAQRQRLYEAAQTAVTHLPLALNISRATLHAGGWKELCHRVCYLLIESQKYQLAWVGRTIPISPIIELYAIAGELPDNVFSLWVRQDESRLSQGPTGQAVQAKHPVIFQPDNLEQLTNVSIEPWQKQFARFGNIAIASFPIVVDATVWGALSLYKGKGQKFSNEEVDVLTEIVADLALGIARLVPAEQQPTVKNATHSSQENTSGEGTLMHRISEFAHDLRHPLTSFKLYLDLMQRGKQQERYMSALHRETDRMHQFIDELMTYTRLRLKFADVLLQPIDLTQLVETLAADREPTIDNNNLRLVVHCESEAAAVLGDAKWLSKIVSNLLANAIRYTEAGGVITVSTFAKQNKGRLGTAVSVADTGIGISLENQVHIFNSIYRVQNHVAAVREGYGL